MKSKHTDCALFRPDVPRPLTAAEVRNWITQARLVLRFLIRCGEQKAPETDQEITLFMSRLEAVRVVMSYLSRRLTDPEQGKNLEGVIEEMKRMPELPGLIADLSRDAGRLAQLYRTTSSLPS